MIRLLFALFLIPAFAGVTFAQESPSHGENIANFDDYIIVDDSSLARDCTFGMFTAFKIDNSKTACVYPDTLRELVSRGWAFPHTNHGSWNVESYKTQTITETCLHSHQVLVQGGYYSTRGFDLELKSIEMVNVDGYPAVSVTLYNPTSSDSGSARFGNANVFVDCIDPDVDNYYDCQDVSRYVDTKNWPILECRTIDGKQFFVDENTEMSKNSGIELYTMNYLDDHTLEFVGKTDRIDEEITFVVTSPDGQDVLEWTDFAPAEGEFRTVVTSIPSWDDGLYIFTAKQDNIPYYTVYLEFQVNGGKIVR